MKSNKVTFPNGKGDTLAGKLELPVDQKPYAYAIFAHCFTCTKNLTAIRNISRALTINGIAVLRFDFTGLGESEGEFENTGFSSNVHDLLQAGEFLKANYLPPALLIGHSFGGPAVMAASTQMPTVKAVATINAPYEPEHVKHLIGDKTQKIVAHGESEVNIGGRSFVIRKEFIHDIESVNIRSKINSLNKALLILHSPSDEIVSVDQAAKIYKAASHPKSFISLDDADHLLSLEEDSLYAGELIGSWVKKYIPGPKEEPLESERRIVVRTSPEGFTTEIKAGNHAFIADEPLDVGGKDLGPTPYDLLVAGLGACTGMTLRMYADHKKWPLKNIMVHLQHGKIYAEDSKDQPGKSNKIDHIVRELELEGDLSPEQRERLLEIANKCPVHKTLHSEISISTELLK